MGKEEKREKNFINVFIIIILCVIAYISKEIYMRVNEMNDYLKDNIHYQNNYIRNIYSSQIKNNKHTGGKSAKPKWEINVQ